MAKEWENNKESFDVIDVRKLTGNFLPMVLKKASDAEVGKGICVVQSFEPIPLYSALADFGFEYFTEKISDNEYRVYFYRKKMIEHSKPTTTDVPLKPTAIVNFSNIDSNLANIAVNFWEYTWDKKNPAIDMKTKLLLSLSNAVGAGRFRQATRELVKAYALGVTIPELDELFALFVWNEGFGAFASNIGPSALFGAYQYIKKLDESGKKREEITKMIVDKFGEKNPRTSTMFKDKVRMCEKIAGLQNQKI
jgi:alkylhydroperoxidase/carboxymuconolactone decarboxylase family protein YurZ